MNDHREPRIPLGRVSRIEAVRQVTAERSGFTRPQTGVQRARRQIERPCQIVLPMLARSHDGQVASFGHPGHTDLRQ